MRIEPSRAAERPRPRLDTGTAYSARVWNYLLNGKDNFGADRAAGDRLMQMFPGIASIARGNRRFLAHAVRYLAGQAGIRQFIDIGTGLPDSTNVHRIAQQIAPQSRIVYVDSDPLVLVHARALLTSVTGGPVDYVEADARDPETILQDAAEILDLSQPTAVMMLSLLGEIPDSDHPGLIVARLLEPLPAGSYLAISDCIDANPALNQAIATYNQETAIQYQLRSPQQFAAFFDGLTMIPPGIVAPAQWSAGLTDTTAVPQETAALCGIGRKD
jgi:S-adenosyl methyltransferase